MKGGSKNHLPLPDKIIDGKTLEENVSFFNIVGHGVQNGNVFVVPENTYIMFLGESGRSIERKSGQITSLKNYRFGKDSENNASWHNRMYQEIRERSFFKDKLFKTNAPYEPLSSSIYEPGDIVQDLFLEFKNPRPPFFLMGLWECPIFENMGPFHFDMNKVKEKEKHVELKSLEGDSIPLKDRFSNITDNTSLLHNLQGSLVKDGMMVDLEDLFVPEYLKEAKKFQDYLPAEKNNLIAKIKLPNMDTSSLSECIHNLFTVYPLKEIRFIVVESCRAIDGPWSPETLLYTANLGGIMNRMGKLEKGIVDEVKSYEGLSFVARQASLMTRQIENEEEKGFLLNKTTLHSIYKHRPTHSLRSILESIESNIAFPIKYSSLYSEIQEFVVAKNKLIIATIQSNARKGFFKAGDYVLVGDGRYSGFVIGPYMNLDTPLSYEVYVVSRKPSVRTLAPVELQKITSDMERVKNKEVDEGILLSMDINLETKISESNARIEKELDVAIQNFESNLSLPLYFRPASWEQFKTDFPEEIGKDEARYHESFQKIDQEHRFRKGVILEVVQSKKEENKGKRGKFTNMFMAPKTNKIVFTIETEDKEEIQLYPESFKKVGTSGGRRTAKNKHLRKKSYKRKVQRL